MHAELTYFILADILGNFQGAFSPEKICWGVNSALETAGTDIRMRRIVEVENEFHCRYNAKSRSYCYRVAVCKEGGKYLTLNRK